MPITSPKSCGRNCAAVWERAPMTSPSIPSVERKSAHRAAVPALALVACFALPLSAWADAVTSANAAYARGDYVGAIRILTPLALHGNARAQAFLGFMYENGYGAPQAYTAAADFYMQAAISGNSFGQAMLGLMYDKGHGVSQ